MYSPTQLAIKYLQYYFTASNGKGHGIHSPFVFHFITSILKDQKYFPEYGIVEKLRKELLKDKTGLMIEDYGAGSALSNTKERSVASIAQNAVKAKKYSQLLFRIIKEYQPATVLELGTSLGITTSYLSLANPKAEIITMEGAASVAGTARNNFKRVGLNNISVVEGDFDKTLSSVISKLSSIDFVFVDGNHRQEPTERYFQQILHRTHNDSILIFDDIHWSKEMEAAWQTIKAHSAVRCTIDLFFIGVVFFRKAFFEKQHFTIRY